MAADATARLTLETGNFQAGIAKAGSLMGGLGSALGKIGGIAAPLAAAAGAVGVAGLAFAGLKKSIDAAADMESLQVAFATLVGSSEKAKGVLSGLTKFAAETPFEMPEIGDAARKLLAFGVSADSVTDELRAVGDIASGVQAPINEIAEIYGKAKVQGRLFAEDINQLTGRGIPVIGQLAQQFGVSESAVKGLVESGAVGFADIQTAFGALTSSGGKFFNMMKLQSGTWNGLLSTLADNWNALFREFGGPVMQTLKPMLQAAAGMIDGLASKAKQIGQSVANVLQGLYGAFQAGDLGKVLSLSLEVAAKSAVNTLAAGFTGLRAAASEALSAAAEVFQQSLGNSSFWEALGKKMESIFLGLKATLLDVVAELVSVLPESLGGGESGATSMRGSANAARSWATVRSLEGDKAFSNIDLGGILAKVLEGGQASLETFQRAAASAPAVYGDLPSKLGELQALLSTSQASVADIFKPIEVIGGDGKPIVAGAAPAGGGEAGKSIATSLAKIGGGGFGGQAAGVGNPALAEARKNNDLTGRIVKAVEKMASSGAQKITYVPVFGAGAA